MAHKVALVEARRRSVAADSDYDEEVSLPAQIYACSKRASRGAQPLITPPGQTPVRGHLPAGNGFGSYPSTGLDRIRKILLIG